VRVCFTPLTLLGFYPSERSPRDEPDASSVTRCLLGIAFLTNRCPRNTRFAGAVDFDLGFVVDGPVGCLQGFTPVSELVDDHLGVTRNGPSRLSWVSPSLRSSPPRRWLSFRRASSQVLFFQNLPGFPGSPCQMHFRVSLHRASGFSLSRAPYLSEVSRLLRSHRFEKNHGPGSWFPLRFPRPLPSA